MDAFKKPRRLSWSEFKAEVFWVTAICPDGLQYDWRRPIAWQKSHQAKALKASFCQNEEYRNKHRPRFTKSLLSNISTLANLLPPFATTAALDVGRTSSFQGSVAKF
ncbi:hypothetical protein HW561_12865 [Rhodobacteraceae bacterium B1Z28]|uniref:Transposase of IS4/5 family DUF4096 n=1 Tax=Ruegeria haliotis TaxID=2747601 RepID=A0ABX2PSZ9_9RHOB|nr:hypothetical protein [Ruegeria haliotis]NVO56677.1 hypothetical protein [Ruegeria haliotis]